MRIGEVLKLRLNDINDCKLILRAWGGQIICIDNKKQGESPLGITLVSKDITNILDP